VLLDEKRTGGELHVTGMCPDGENYPGSSLRVARLRRSGVENAEEKCDPSHVPEATYRGQ
jgi:hypothetical protein